MKSMREKITVMVTGLTGGGLGEQILKALRLAGDRYTVVGGDMSPEAKDLAEVEHPLTLPPASAEDYLEAVALACNGHGVRALFPGSEPELTVLGRNRKVLEDAGVLLPVNPPEVLDICLDKFRTNQWLRVHGFDFPATFLISGSDDLERVPDSALPAVLKPATGGGGSNNLHLAQTPEELRFLGQYLLWNLGPFVVQQYVGDPDSEYTVGVLSDMDGVFINSIALRRSILSGLSNRLKVKNRTGKKELGEILAVSSGVSQGRIGRFPEITSVCEEIARKMGARGPLNIQGRRHQGRFFVFEINPRFSGTAPLRALAGFNEPDLLIRRHLLGEKIQPRFEYRQGRAARGLSEIFREGSLDHDV